MDHWNQASVSFVLCSFSYPPGGKGIHWSCWFCLLGLFFCLFPIPILVKHKFNQLSQTNQNSLRLLFAELTKKVEHPNAPNCEALITWISLGTHWLGTCCRLHWNHQHSSLGLKEFEVVKVVVVVVVVGGGGGGGLCQRICCSETRGFNAASIVAKFCFTVLFPGRYRKSLCDHNWP